MKLLILISLFFVFYSATSQSYHLVKFTDKSNNGYSVNNPEAFLSPRAIQRRQNQNISIEYKDLPITQDYINAVLDIGGVLKNKSKWFNSITIELSDSILLDSIENLSFVLSVGGIEKRKSLLEDKLEIESLEKTNNLFNVKSTSALNYGDAFDQINLINGIPIHEAGFMGQGMLIAVFDAGFTDVNNMAVFDSLFANNQILETYDFVNKDTSVYELHTHGTMVLSVMGGNEPGVLVGTAPKANYSLYITEDVSGETLLEEDNWISAAERADSVGADIINSSLGYTEMDNPEDSHEYADLTGDILRISQAADIAAAKGILVVNSAGNSGSSSWYYIGAPADGDSVLTVGAVNVDGVIADFSSRGPSADGDIKPNVCGVGEGSAIASTNGGTFFGNGTSFSSPIIAGMSACLWQCMPASNNMELKKAIEESSHMYQNPDFNYGYGIPNYQLAHGLLTGVDLVPAFNVNVAFGPNPFEDYLQISFDVDYSGELVLEMYDVSGKIIAYYKVDVQENETQRIQMDLKSELAKGVYFIRINNDLTSLVYPVVKQ